MFGCRSFDSISEERSKLERSKAVYLLDTARKDMLEITYNHAGVDLSLKLFLDEHEFELEFDKKPGDEQNLNVTSTSLNKSNKIVTEDGSKLPAPNSLEFKKDLNKVMYYYNAAQTKFYKDDYNGSITSLDSSLSIMPTSDAFAMKGSIMFVMKRYDMADYYWKEAKKLDPKFIIPKVIKK